MHIRAVLKSMHVRPKEEMKETVFPLTEFSLRREPPLLMHKSYVPLQNLRELYQQQQPHRRLGMPNMEETPKMATRWTRTVRSTATSPWTSRWA